METERVTRIDSRSMATLRVRFRLLNCHAVVAPFPHDLPKGT